MVQDGAFWYEHYFELKVIKTQQMRENLSSWSSTNLHRKGEPVPGRELLTEAPVHLRNLSLHDRGIFVFQNIFLLLASFLSFASSDPTPLLSSNKEPHCVWNLVSVWILHSTLLNLIFSC